MYVQLSLWCTDFCVFVYVFAGVMCSVRVFMLGVVMLIVGLKGVVRHSFWPVRRAIRRCLNCYWSTVQIQRCVYACMCLYVHAYISAYYINCVPIILLSRILP